MENICTLYSAYVVRKWSNHKKKEIKFNIRADAETTPKYRTYHVATKSTKTLVLELSPGARRRCGHVILDFQVQESIVWILSIDLC